MLSDPAERLKGKPLGCVPLVGKRWFRSYNLAAVFSDVNTFQNNLR